LTIGSRVQIVYQSTRRNLHFLTLYQPGIVSHRCSRRSPAHADRPPRDRNQAARGRRRRRGPAEETAGRARHVDWTAQLGYWGGSEQIKDMYYVVPRMRYSILHRTHATLTLAATSVPAPRGCLSSRAGQPSTTHERMATSLIVPLAVRVATSLLLEADSTSTRQY
jgi:hypothetical protein